MGKYDARNKVSMAMSRDNCNRQTSNWKQLKWKKQHMPVACRQQQQRRATSPRNDSTSRCSGAPSSTLRKCSPSVVSQMKAAPGEVTTTGKQRQGDDDGHATSDNVSVMHDSDWPLAGTTTRPSTSSRRQWPLSVTHQNVVVCSLSHSPIYSE